MNFDQLENCIWAVVITETTVGYGDYFPRTLTGRILVIVIAIWGNFITSMLVITLQNTIESILILNFNHL